MANEAHSLLSPLSVQQFLQDYWQKQPYLFKNAIPNYQTPITAEELAGLACEEGVEARLIVEKHGQRPWEVSHGPFEDNDFTSLPETHWTLLVQDCNKYIPELMDLLDQFNFIPNWRVDDVMVSYAPQFGSVGPHTDQYDVFLLQGLGRRRWQINQQKTDKDDLIPDLDLQILQNFSAQQSWDLEPGDMLYLPPGVAHYGVALEPCMTMSVGFRAPSRNDLVAAYLDHLLLQNELNTRSNDNDPRYVDTILHSDASPGEISEQALFKLQQLMLSEIRSTHNFSRWFGQYITQPKGEILENDEDNVEQNNINEALLCQKLNEGESIQKSENTKGTYIVDSNLRVFSYFAGEEFTSDIITKDLVRLLCEQRYFCQSDLSEYLAIKECMDLLIKLVNSGHLYFYDET